MTDNELESLELFRRESRELYDALFDLWCESGGLRVLEVSERLDALVHKSRGISGGLGIFVDRVEKRRGK